MELKLGRLIDLPAKFDFHEAVLKARRRDGALALEAALDILD